MTWSRAFRVALSWGFMSGGVIAISALPVSYLFMVEVPWQSVAVAWGGVALTFVCGVLMGWISLQELVAREAKRGRSP